MISPCRIAYLVTANAPLPSMMVTKVKLTKSEIVLHHYHHQLIILTLDLTTTAEETDVSNDKKLNYSRLLVSAKDNFLSREKAHP